jgi:hypothetical protein
MFSLPDIDAAVMVTDVGPSNNTLVLTTCQRFLGYDWTGVFSRDKNLDPVLLGRVNERLTDAGVQNVDSAVAMDTATCPVLPGTS